MALFPKYHATKTTGTVREDVVGQARQKAAVVAKAGNVVDEAILHHDKAATDRETAKLLAEKRDFTNKHAGKDFYNASEIPEDVDVRRTETVVGDDGVEYEEERTNIPSYEVYPQMFARHMDTALASKSANVPPRMRRQWASPHGELLEKEKQKQTVAAAKAQTAEIRTEQEAAYNESLLQRDWNTAMFQAKSFNGSDSEREAKVNVVRKLEETSSYYDSMSEEDVPRMKSQLAYLKADGEYKGRMNEQERRTMVYALEARLGQASAKGRGRNAAYDVKLEKDGKRTIEAWKEGKSLDPRETQRLGWRIYENHKADLSNKGKAKLWSDYQEMQKQSPQTNEFMRMPLTEQQAYMDSLESDTGTDEWTKDVYRNLHANSQKMLTEDTVSYMRNLKIADVEDLDFSNPMALSSSIQKRVIIHDQALATWGESAGLLTKAESRQMSEAMDKMTSQEKVAFIGMQYKTLGDDAVYLWQQMGDDGVDASASAGLLASEGRLYSGQLLLEGREFSKNNPTAVPKRADYAPFLVDGLKDVYTASPVESKRAAIGVMNIYAALSQKEGDLTGEFDEERLETAIEHYTGGVAEVGSSNISTPKGFSTDQIDSHIKYLDKEFWESSGGLQGYDGQYERVSPDIRKGDIKLQQIGSNEFLLFSRPTGQYLNKPNGDNFVFSFDRSQPMNMPVSGTRRQIRDSN